MKPSCFLLVLIIYSTAFAQNGKNKLVEKDSLHYKSIQLLLPFSSRFPKFGARGSGFFIKYNDHYFLVTNYHVLTGRTWEDTSRFINAQLNHEFEKAMVTVYTANQKEYETVDFTLHDANSNRRYASLPVNKTTKQVALDIAVLKIDSLPADVRVNAIDLSGPEETWEIPPNTTLLSYGYSKRTWADLYPFCDSIHSVGDRTFSNKDNYIAVYNPPNMHGSSGSPVYFKKNGRHHFIGVFFAVVPYEYRHDRHYDDLFPITYYGNAIGFIITASYLKQSLDRLLNGTPELLVATVP